MLGAARREAIEQVDRVGVVTEPGGDQRRQAAQREEQRQMPLAMARRWRTNRRNSRRRGDAPAVSADVPAARFRAPQLS